jgi:hypothetical protein
MARRRRLSPCNHPGCSELTQTTTCTRHQRHQPPQTNTYGTAHHERRRHAWQNQPCQTPGCPRTGHHLDHADGNPHNTAPENEQWLCHHHHSQKTVKHDGGFGRPRTPRPPTPEGG